MTVILWGLFYSFICIIIKVIIFDFRSELRTAVQQIGFNLSDQAINYIYKNFDANNDGKINFKGVSLFFFIINLFKYFKTKKLFKIIQTKKLKKKNNLFVYFFFV